MSLTGEPKPRRQAVSEHHDLPLTTTLVTITARFGMVGRRVLRGTGAAASQRQNCDTERERSHAPPEASRA